MPDHVHDRAWIDEHAQEYRGKWVLVCGGQLIAADHDIRSIIARVPRDMYPDALVTYIATEEEERQIVL